MGDIGVTHKTTTVTLGRAHRAECACGWRGPWTRNQDHAHDWATSHLSRYSSACDRKPDEAPRG